MHVVISLDTRLTSDTNHNERLRPSCKGGEDVAMSTNFGCIIATITITASCSCRSNDSLGDGDKGAKTS